MRKFIMLPLFLLFLCGCAADSPLRAAESPDKAAPDETRASASSPPPSGGADSPATAQPSASASVSGNARTSEQAPSSVPAPASTPTPAPTPRTASFETELPPSSANRITNIKTAAKKLDGFIIKAGEDFSFNRDVGPRTVKAGYRKATMFLNKKKVLAVGGGVCQISTTIYNAALLMELPVTERHEHHKEVQYIEKGMDATVNYGSLDLKFENNTKNDIKIHCAVDKKKVHVTFTEIIAA